MRNFLKTEDYSFVLDSESLDSWYHSFTIILGNLMLISLCKYSLSNVKAIPPPKLIKPFNEVIFQGKSFHKYLELYSDGIVVLSIVPMDITPFLSQGLKLSLRQIAFEHIEVPVPPSSPFSMQNDQLFMLSVLVSSLPPIPLATKSLLPIHNLINILITELNYSLNLMIQAPELWVIC